MWFSSSLVAKSLLLEHSQDFASETASGCICNQFQKQLCSFSLPCTGDNSAPLAAPVGCQYMLCRINISLGPAGEWGL